MHMNMILLHYTPLSSGIGLRVARICFTSAMIIDNRCSVFVLCSSVGPPCVIHNWRHLPLPAVRYRTRAEAVDHFSGKKTALPNGVRVPPFMRPAVPMKLSTEEDRWTQPQLVLVKHGRRGAPAVIMEVYRAPTVSKNATGTTRRGKQKRLICESLPTRYVSEIKILICEYHHPKSLVVRGSSEPRIKHRDDINCELGGKCLQTFVWPPGAIFELDSTGQCFLFVQLTNGWCVCHLSPIRFHCSCLE